MIRNNGTPNGELIDKTRIRKFKMIVPYMGSPRLPLAQMFPLLPVICDISDPPSQRLEIHKLKKLHEKTAT